jgi:tetratricopeptide (TPR) repeat protein
LALTQPELPDLAVRPAQDPAWLAPPEGDAAATPLEAILAQSTPTAPAPAPATDEAPTSWEAVRDYVHARQKLAAGDDAGAVPLLQSALRRDPDSPAVWRELGEAQLRQGRTAAAMTAFQEAARRGIDEPRVLWLLGRDAARARRPLDAIRLLAAAAPRAAASDPALPNLVWADLGETLLARGSLAAGAQAIDRAVDLPEQFQAPTRYRLELGELFRRRGELALAAADARARLGRTDEALAAYAALVDRDAPEAAAAASRRVELLLRSGRSAQAALEMLDAVDRDAGRIDERGLGVLALLASSEQTGPPLRRAVESLAPADADTLPSEASRWARIRAAAAGDGLAGVIAEHLVRMPSDEDSLRFVVNDAIDRADAGRAAARVPALLMPVIEAAPWRAEALGAVAVDAGPDPAAVLRLLARDGSPAGELLHAAALLHLGLPREAADALGGASFPAASAPAALELRTRAAVEAGRFQDLPALVDAARALAASGDARAAESAARALASARRFTEALDALGPTPPPPRATPESRRRAIERELLTAGLLARLGRGEDAAQALARAGQIDPGDERVWSALLAVHGPGGPAQDPQRFAAAGRALHDRAANSRTLRWLTAQELAARQLAPRAEPLLRALVEEDPTDRAPLGLLASLWEASEGRSAPGVAGTEPLAWLEARGSNRQSSPAVLAARVRVLASMDRGEESLNALAQARGALDTPAWAQLGERIEAKLHPGPDARRASLARLAQAPPSIGNTLDYAELLESGGEPTPWDLLRQRLPAPHLLPLTPDESGRVTAMASRAVQRAVAQRSPDNDRAALALLDEAARHTAQLPLGLHQARLTLLTAGPFIDTAQLAGAVELAARQHPRPNAEWPRSIAARLLGGQFRPQGVRFLERIVAADPDPPVELVAEYVNATGLFGDEATARALLDRVTDPRLIEAVLARFDAPPKPPGASDPGLRARADLAYRLASLAYLADDEPRANQIYRMGLAFDPSHAWIANDLGYHLVEAGQSMGEAEMLLERAFAALPTESSVVDSLGWLRYRTGVIDDARDAEGRVVKPGAVTLLRRAAQLDLEGDNATIFDHLGDALWMAGDRDGAVEAWTRAEAVIRSQIQGVRPEPGAASRFRDRLAGQQRTLTEKIRAARAGGQPPIAPRLTPAP